jgi:hypothetical protein
VDGSHEPLQIVRDAMGGYEALEQKGILWFDDYLGGGGKRDIQNALDYWTKLMGERVEIIHRGYQLGMRKRG